MRFIHKTLLLSMRLMVNFSHVQISQLDHASNGIGDAARELVVGELARRSNSATSVAGVTSSGSRI